MKLQQPEKMILSGLISSKKNEIVLKTWLSARFMNKVKFYKFGKRLKFHFYTQKYFLFVKKPDAIKKGMNI